VAAVFFVMLRNPSKLMLGEVTGEEFRHLQRVTLVDSLSGEREVTKTSGGSGSPLALIDSTPYGENTGKRSVSSEGTEE
jgi:hypothetical protein